MASESPASTCWKLPGLTPGWEEGKRAPALRTRGSQTQREPPVPPPTAGSIPGAMKPFTAPAYTDKLRSRSSPHARPPRPRRLTLVGLRQRVLPFQVLERLTRPDLPWPLPRPQQKEKEQHPGPIPSRQTPPPPLPPPRGYQGHRHLSHCLPFIESPPRPPSHWPMEPPASRPIGSRRVPAPAGEHFTDWLA